MAAAAVAVAVAVAVPVPVVVVSDTAFNKDSLLATTEHYLCNVWQKTWEKKLLASPPLPRPRRPTTVGHPGLKNPMRAGTQLREEESEKCRQMRRKPTQPPHEELVEKCPDSQVEKPLEAAAIFCIFSSSRVLHQLLLPLVLLVFQDVLIQILL